MVSIILKLGNWSRTGNLHNHYYYRSQSVIHGICHGG